MFKRGVLAVVGVLGFAASAQAIDFALVPVGASGHHVIEGNQITLFSGGGTVTLEIRISNWDPDQDGDPLLRAYQLRIDSDGFYTSGTSGHLGVDRIPCDDNSDCPSGAACTDFMHVCEANDAAWIESSHIGFVFHGLAVDEIVGTAMPDFLYAAFVWNRSESVADPGIDQYAGTLVLDVSGDAFGTFEVGFLGGWETFGASPDGQPLFPGKLIAARIIVVRDCNLNGVGDEKDIAGGSSEDCNDNGRPDECESDCNGNHIPDDCDIARSTSEDVGGNGVPDECDPDCNANGAADDGDIAFGASEDCNINAVPDDCEPGGDQDCDGDSVSDLCALVTGFSLDCNKNGVPDNCDIASGVSEDCTGNGIPDECEPDCNRNGAADTCDLASGESIDDDGDGVPDDCFLGFALVPVGADVPHQLHGNEIIIPPGGARVTVEIRVAGWGRSNPLALLRAYEAVLDMSGLTSGSAGSLSLAALPCETGLDCFSTATCKDDGFCEKRGALFLDLTHPAAVYRGFAPTILAVPRGSHFGLATILTDVWGVADPGMDRMAGTILLDVAPDAIGTFTIELRPEYSLWDSMHGPVVEPSFFPALITVLTDCNDNGIADAQDIANGTSQDVDGNGVPDECELDVPFVDVMGSRRVAIAPKADDVAPVALHVASPQFPCLRKFIAPTGDGGAVLSDSPVYLPPAEWGSVVLSDIDIVAGSAYEVQAEYLDGRRSWAATAFTWRYGDTDGNDRADVRDIANVVNVLKDVDTSEAGIAAANVWDCDMAEVVNVLDIAGVVDAIFGKPYPCAIPCE